MHGSVTYIKGCMYAKQRYACNEKKMILHNEDILKGELAS